MGKCKKKKRSDSVFQTFRKINVKKLYFKKQYKNSLLIDISLTARCTKKETFASLLNLRVNSHFFLIYTYPYFHPSPSWFVKRSFFKIN